MKEGKTIFMLNIYLDKATIVTVCYVNNTIENYSITIQDRV